MTAKLLFYKTRNNGVNVKVYLGDDRSKNSFTRPGGMGRSCKFNKGKDRDEYPVIVTYKALYSFLKVNGIDDKDVAVDERSIDNFYGYSGYGKEDVFVSLADSKINAWYNYDCPVFYRYAVNKDKRSNDFGLSLLCFQNLICESTWSAIHIGDDITEEEVRAFTKGREQNGIAQEMFAVLESRKLTDEDYKVIESEIELYEKNIQAVIDNNVDEILNHVAGMIDNSYGLDCGFITIKTTNKEIQEKKRLLKNVSNSEFGELNVVMPRASMSTTVLRKQFEKVKEIVARELGEEIYSFTRLD